MKVFTKSSRPSNISYVKGSDKTFTALFQTDTGAVLPVSGVTLTCEVWQLVNGVRTGSALLTLSPSSIPAGNSAEFTITVAQGASLSYGATYYCYFYHDDTVVQADTQPLALQII